MLKNTWQNDFIVKEESKYHFKWFNIILEQETMRETTFTAIRNPNFEVRHVNTINTTGTINEIFKDFYYFKWLIKLIRII